MPEDEFCRRIKKNRLQWIPLCLRQVDKLQTPSKSNETDPGKQIKRIIQIGRHDMKLFVNAIFHNFSQHFISFRFRFHFLLLLFPLFSFFLFWHAPHFGFVAADNAEKEMETVCLPLLLQLYIVYIVCIRFTSVSVSIRVLFHGIACQTAQTCNDRHRHRHRQRQRGKSCDCFQMFY